MRRPETRLVTLTGPGGVGKTRLALQAAAELLDQFPQGVWFVNLAPLRDPALVMATIAQTLGIRELGGRTLAETVRDALREQDLLLLLDNFEQVVTAAPDLTSLLAAAPRVSILVTSREALHLSGEQLVAVPPLTLPELRSIASSENPAVVLSQYEAVGLFIDRARAVRADFAINDQSAPVVAEICYRLDGLPLAIELAAARVRFFTPEALLRRLGHRLQLLTNGPHDLPVRQQTLRSTIEWSYALLKPGEQALLRRVAIFVGGWSIAAAAAVGDTDEIVALDLLAALADKSLLREERGPDGEPRFGILETVREYAREQLEQAGEPEVVGELHARYYLDLAEQAEPQLRGARAVAWMKALAADHENLRAVLAWFDGHGDHKRMVRLCYALWRYWYDRGHWIEGRAALEIALQPEALAALPAGLQARAQLFAGMFLARQSEVERAQRLLDRSLALFCMQGDRGGQIDVLYGLAITDQGHSDYITGAQRLREAVQLSQEIGDRYRTALCLDWLSYVLYVLGDLPAVEPLAWEALAIFRELAITDHIGALLANLGYIAYGRGDLARASELLEESITLLRRFGGTFDLSSAINYLGQVMLAQDAPPRAVELCRKALDLRRRLGDRRGMVAVLVPLILATFVLGERQAAAAQMRNALTLAHELDYHQCYAWLLRIAAQIAELGGDQGHSVIVNIATPNAHQPDPLVSRTAQRRRRNRLAKVPLIDVAHREGVQAGGGIGMLWAERLLVDGQRPFEEQPSRGVARQRLLNACRRVRQFRRRDVAARVGNAEHIAQVDAHRPQRRGEAGVDQLRPRR